MLADNRPREVRVPHLGNLLRGREDVAVSVLRPSGALPKVGAHPTYAPQAPRDLDRQAGRIKRPIERSGRLPKIVHDQQTAWDNEGFHDRRDLLHRKMVEKVDADHAVERAQSGRKPEDIRLDERDVPARTTSRAGDPQHLG